MAAAQALETALNGWDTAAGRSFRGEQRGWREEDICWRSALLQHAEASVAHRRVGGVVAGASDPMCWKVQVHTHKREHSATASNGQ